MAYTTVDDPTQFFNTILWTGAGDSSARSFTGVGFQPDWVWYKCRTDTYNHNLVDSVRGAGADKELVSNSNVVEGGGDSSTHGYLSSFDSDGFSSANGSSNNLEFNQNGESFVAWNWKAGTSFTNDASATSVGSIDSAGSINTTAGFSIISYTGTGSAGTVAHGLGVVPAMIIVKPRDTADNWRVYHKGMDSSAPEDYHMRLNSTDARDNDAGFWNDTAPTSSVFTIGTNQGVSKSSDNFISYCFAEKQGYSKFGSYQGNGNADGTFVYTGFKPAFVLLKQTNSTNYWNIYDNKRDVDNAVGKRLHPNTSDAETSNTDMDFTAQGFKLRNSGANQNGSGSTYIYMAFAESPFTNSNGVPNNAR